MKLVKASLGRLALLRLVPVGLFGCDYATKSAAKATLEGTAGIAVAPELLRGAVELRYVENHDIAFSVLRRLGIPRSPELLVGIATVALVVIVVATVVARRHASRAGAPYEANASAIHARGRKRALGVGSADLATLAGIALVLSGALGNIVDRVVRGYVVDFIHVKGWPVFNVADIAVVVGAILLALVLMHRRGETELEGPLPAEANGSRPRRRGARSVTAT